MGGFGSTRWGWHRKKIQVEHCHKLTIYSLKPYLNPGTRGSAHWSRGGQEAGSISYRVSGNESPERIQLLYTITDRSTGEKTDYDYFIPLQTTPLPWGGVRYWFTCPLVIDNQACQRRAGCLYLPPGGRYFGCRHCYNLAYRSNQEQHQWDGLYASLASSMLDEYPGITGKDVRAILEDRPLKRPLRGPVWESWMGDLENALEYDRYANYLTEEEICLQSGLSAENLSHLKAARLLLPDTKDGRYRPKLAGWGRKLAFLIGEGWKLDEIRLWAKGRWNMENPRKWPPEKEKWVISP